MTLRNTAFILFFPALMLAAGLVVIFSHPKVPWSVGIVMAAAPYVIAALAALVGGWFKSPRVVLLAALIAAAHWVVQTFVVGVNIDSRGPEITVVYGAVAVMFPVNAVLIAMKPDRGLLSLGVFSRVLFITLQVAVVIVMWDGGQDTRAAADALLHARVFSPEFDHWSLLPQAALLLFGAVGVVLLVRAVWTGAVLDGGLFGAVAMVGLALHAAGNGALSSILFTMAGAVLLVAVAHEGYRLAFIDELTGLPGRRALMHDLMALRGTYTVAMLDVDHFKKFNDTYGHDVGDQVLKMVAAQMMRVTGGGRAYRYGGEEFTVLFARKSLRDAVMHLNKLRQAIAKASFKLRAEDRPRDKPDGPKGVARPQGAGETVSVTISIGVALREDGQAPRDALKSADGALYRAKDGGRNRVAQ